MDLRRVSRAVRALRIRRGWRQEDLAREAKLSRSIVGRVERAEADGLTVHALDAVAVALGATLQLDLRWQGEGLDRLLDEGHATLVDRVVTWLRAHGWEVAVEVSFARGGERGSIDVLAWHPVRRALVVIEVESITPDIQRCCSGSTGRRAWVPVWLVIEAGMFAPRRGSSCCGTRGRTGDGSRRTRRLFVPLCRRAPGRCSPGSGIRPVPRRRASGS